MKIRHIFHNEAELVQKLGEHFVLQWKRLLAEYEKRRKSIGCNPMRVATIAFAFYSGAVDGNARMGLEFDHMLHGQSQELLVMNDVPVCVLNKDEEMLVWDTVALMLEENETLCNTAQWAYEVAGQYVWLAYSVPQESCAEEVKVVKPTQSEVKDIDKEEVAVPVICSAVEEISELDKMIGYAESLCPERIDEARAIQTMLFSLYSRTCTEEQHQRIIAIPETVLAKKKSAPVQVAGDYVVKKEVQHEVNGVEDGGKGIYIRYGREE